MCLYLDSNAFDREMKKKYITANRNSRSEVFCKKDVLRNFAKFTRKHLCQRLFFNNVAGLRRASLLKKGLWHRCFPVYFAKFLRIPFLKEHLRWLLLSQITCFCQISNTKFNYFKTLCFQEEKRNI